jgi:hypothetical protein
MHVIRSAFIWAEDARAKVSDFGIFSIDYFHPGEYLSYITFSNCCWSSLVSDVGDLYQIATTTPAVNRVGIAEKRQERTETWGHQTPVVKEKKKKEKGDDGQNKTMATIGNVCDPPAGSFFFL